MTRTAGLVIVLTLVALGCARRLGREPAGQPAAPLALAGPARGGPVDPAPRVGSPDWSLDAVVYEVFVRSFKDSDGDGVGDLRGLIQSLDRLNDGDPETTSDLGVTALWLMPIFAASSDHGYDSVDFMRVEPAYGDLADLRELLEQAHRRGVRVILDLMLNHTSDQHPWFVEAARSPSSPRRHWYVWRDQDPGWVQPWNASQRTWHRHGDAHYYGLFHGGMPDLNLQSAAVREALQQVASYWLQLGVDGFRLDAARHAIEGTTGNEQADTAATHAFWRDFSARIVRAFPDALVLGEVWADADTIASYHARPPAIELPMTFDFPLAAAIVDGIQAADARTVAQVLKDRRRLYPPGSAHATFVGNHDLPRLATSFGGQRDKLRLAAALLLTLPGTPFVYYGEELGLGNAAAEGDRAQRAPYPWSPTPGGGFSTAAAWLPLAKGQPSLNLEAELQDPGSLWQLYRQLIELRQQRPALRRGSTELLLSHPAGRELLIFVRQQGVQRLLVAHNCGPGHATSQKLELPLEGAQLLFHNGTAELVDVAGTGGTVVMGPRASAVWLLSSPVDG